eukprot:6989265-Prymnesium_polylepis.1
MAPRGPACDSSGGLYAVEASGQWIHSFPPPGHGTHERTPARCKCVYGDPDGLDGLLTPDTCAVADGTLYVSDSGHDRVVVFCAATLTHRLTLGGTPSDSDGHFNRPQGLAARSGILAVCDAGNSRVQLFEARDGAFMRALGRHGAAPGCFVEPRGVGILHTGSSSTAPLVLLVVAESRRLQVLTLQGESLQVVVPSALTPSSFTQPHGPPGLWGVAVGFHDTHAFVVNTISNELHVLAVCSQRLRG